MRYKRLEEGEFRWLKMQDGVMHHASDRGAILGFSALFEGLDWKRVHAREPKRVPVAPH
ncbi:transposase [Ensifer sp. 1H6]|uniref:transposase n=1 Tax=Ensifer sp. 1H6 TaxID=1911585 RepID=UPI0011773976|nr:transposase [Ensifer sp. 1H6]